MRWDHLLRSASSGVVDAGLAAVGVDETSGGGMAFREVRVFEIHEMLRLWLGDESLRAIVRRRRGRVLCR